MSDDILHSSGPWIARRTDDGHEIRMARALVSGPAIHGVEEIVEWEHGTDPDSEELGTPAHRQALRAEANAHLMAAAPVMLEALQLIRSEFPGTRAWSPGQIAVAAALQHLATALKSERQ